MAQAESRYRRVVEDGTLSIAVGGDGPERVIELFGELDAACVGTLTERLEEAMGGRFESVVVDLRGLDFIDSKGIEAIYRAVEACRANGTRLGLVRGSGEVERIVALVGLDKWLPFLD